MSFEYPANLKIIALRQEDFRRRWCPDNPAERDEFNNQLAYLVHTIYHEAMMPMAKQMAKVLSKQIRPLVITKLEDLKG